MLMRSLGLASLVVSIGCIGGRAVELPDDVDQDKAEAFEIPQSSPPPLDILIVVDNSAQMAAYEQNVLANLPAFGTYFEANKGWWDRRIAVVTADVGCPDRPTWRPANLINGSFFIDWRHLDDTRTKNFEGTLEDHLPALMAAGHDGCGAHRPFDAIVAAIDPDAGFRRIEADLMIVIIGASDDQSVNGVAETLAAVGEACVPALNSRMRTLSIAPQDASRLAAFASEFGSGDHVAITRENLTEPLAWFVRGDIWGQHCFETTAIDLDPAEGMQAHCSISDVVRDDTNNVTYERQLPACDGSNRPCWRIAAQEEACSFTGYGLAFDRIDFPPRGAVTVGQCEILENAGE